MTRRWIALLTLCAALLAPFGPSEPAAAIDGDRYCPATGHWYKLYVTYNQVTWTECEARAEAAGGYLATITSAAEQNWLVANGFFSGGASGGAAFVGGTDRKTEGKWEWVTGEAWGYSNWEPNQPDNQPYPANYLRVEQGGKWRDVLGAWNAYGYVVEWEKDPNGSGPPEPPPPPAGTTDLAVLSVTLSPPSPGIGDEVRVSIVVRNEGGPSGPVTARFGLEGFDGPALAETILTALGTGATTSTVLAARVPDDLPSGEYRATVVVWPASTNEVDPSDNVGRVDRAIRVEQPPVGLVPGKLEGALGPLGRQAFILDAFPELRARLKAKLKKGYGPKRLEREDDETVLAEATAKGKLKHAISGEDGRLLLLVESEEGRSTRYRVSLKAKAIRLSGQIALGPDPTELEIPGLEGMRASIKLKGLDGSAPALDLGESTGEARTSHTKVKAKGIVLEGEGPWLVRVTGAGRCSYSIKVK